MFRHLIAALLFLPACSSLHAQRIDGTITGFSDHQVLLLLCRGEQCTPLDSVRTDAKGHFVFNTRLPGAGVYALALSDDDRVDLMLDGTEPVVTVEFSGTPLDEHIQVRASDENKRFQELRAAAREAEAVRLAVMQAKTTLKPTDYMAIRQQDSLASVAERDRTDHVRRLIDEAPNSYFARVVKADAAVGATSGKSPMAVAEAFDLSDPTLLRTSVYDKAVMTFLRNVNAVHEDQFLVASDTLMELAGHDPSCKAYMLEHLLDLFSTYGPDRAAQHLLDKYVVQAKVPMEMPPALKARVSDMMKVAVGATGEDLALNDNGTPFQLSAEAKLHKYTLLFFYSSTCEHCHAEIPKLEGLYTAYSAKGFAVLGLALDADSSEFRQRIADSAIPWPCYSEFIGWGAKSAKAYQVKATPAFYLLDDRLHIVAKPYDAAELATLLPGFLP